MTIITKISSLKSDEMGKQLMHIFMVLDKKTGTGCISSCKFNKILSLERSMLKTIQIFCDVTPWQVPTFQGNIVPPPSGSRSPLFFLTHLYIHHFSMVGSNFSLHTKDSMFGENIFFIYSFPIPFPSFLPYLDLICSFLPIPHPFYFAVQLSFHSPIFFSPIH